MELLIAHILGILKMLDVLLLKIVKKVISIFFNILILVLIVSVLKRGFGAIFLIGLNDFLEYINFNIFLLYRICPIIISKTN